MLYGTYSEGYSYSPDRSRDVDRFNPSVRGNYSTAFANASGSRQNGYYYSPSYPSHPTYSSKLKGRYLGNGQYVED